MSITNLNNYNDLLSTAGIFESINPQALVVRTGQSSNVDLLVCNTRDMIININLAYLLKI